MIQSLFVISSSGEVIIEKHWRGVVSRAICNEFWDEVCKSESPDEVLPIITTSKHYLIHVHRNGLFFLSTVQTEVSPLLVIEFLNRSIEIFHDYFGEVSEDAIKENFVTVYQLLDEMLDNGLPLTTEPSILKSIILPPSFANKIMTTMGGQSGVRADLPTGTSAVPWRRPDVKYASNEIYFDIVEEVDCILDREGAVISSETNGEIQCSCRLSGMPDLTLSFTDPSVFDDCSFHPCVRYARYEADRVISFVPPDGFFRLMTYRVRHQTHPPLYVKPQISGSGTAMRINIMVGSKYQVSGKIIEDIVITMPLPKSVASANLSANYGTVVYDEINKVCKWTVGKLLRDKTPVLSGSANLHPNQTMPDSNPPLSVEFKVSMYCISGVKIENLHVATERYRPYKGVRSLTKAGKFHVRC